MSGGVDSSVAALLLKKQSYDVEGLFMKNWEEDFEPNAKEPDKKQGCNATEDFIDAEAVCLKLGIRLRTVNFSNDYWDRVFSYFLEEYKAGRTPNPDVLCNKEIKFKAFLDHALELGADYIATGHFVRRGQENNELQLLKGLDNNKDQSYFLYTLNQHQLSHALFPVGDLDKATIRKLAKEAGFKNHAKKDSTGICFIGERKFKNFLSQYLPAQPGNIETPDGKVIGKHDGLMYYTLGQRQGLGIGGLKNQSEDPWFVAKKDLKRNVLIAVQGHDNPIMFSESLIADQLHWVSGKMPELPLKCRAKTRYRQVDQPCMIIKQDDDSVEVIFEKPQRAITPGQSVVFYQSDVCLGGGVIEKS